MAGGGGGAQADKNQVQSVARTWFERWGYPLEQQLGSDEALRRIDSGGQSLLRLSLRTSKREKYRSCINAILRDLREIATEDPRPETELATPRWLPV